jgi:hypothetical protein
MKEINNYTNYLIYSDGKVYSKKRKKFLKQDITSSYARVTLCNEAGAKRFSVHRLVALHFIDNLENKPDINHIDSNRLNNDISNLEWCSHSENMKHCHQKNRCSNLIASNKAKELSDIKMEEKFKLLLGNRFISHTTENNRGYITFNCICCSKEVTSRSDSSSFKKGGVCLSCIRKKKI